MATVNDYYFISSLASGLSQHPDDDCSQAQILEAARTGKLFKLLAEHGEVAGWEAYSRIRLIKHDDLTEMAHSYAHMANLYDPENLYLDNGGSGWELVVGWTLLIFQLGLGFTAVPPPHSDR